MNIKTVQILQSGKEIKTFKCAACDMTGKMLQFFGVVNKNGLCDNSLSINHYGETYIEIDHAKHECIVNSYEPEFQLLITW
jgi:hypothetical protein